MEYKGKCAFITGAAQGIGKVYADILLQKGWKVCLTDINVQQGESTCKELQTKFDNDRVMFVKCDVMSTEGMKAAFQKAVSAFKYIDIFINNAGIVHERKMELCVDINFQGVIRGVNLALDHMRHDRGGHGGVIVNTASITVASPVNFVPIYNGTKWAIAGFGKSWALHPEVINSGIRIICLCPDVVDTPIQNSESVSDDTTEGLDLVNQYRNTKNPMRPSDIGDALIKVLDDKNNSGSLLKIENNNNNDVLLVK